MSPVFAFTAISSPHGGCRAAVPGARASQNRPPSGVTLLMFGAPGAGAAARRSRADRRRPRGRARAPAAGVAAPRPPRPPRPRPRAFLEMSPLAGVHHVRDDQPERLVEHHALPVAAADRARETRRCPASPSRGCTAPCPDRLYFSHRPLQYASSSGVTFASSSFFSDIARERRRLERKRLRRRRPLALRRRLRHRTLFHAVHRLAGLAIEDEQDAHLRDQRDAGNRAAVAPHVDERRRRGQIVVPDVVMHELLIPLDLAGVRVDREQAVAVQVVAVMRTAVVVVADFLDRHEEQPALDVDREVCPRGPGRPASSSCR